MVKVNTVYRSIRSKREFIVLAICRDIVYCLLISNNYVPKDFSLEYFMDNFTEVK